MALGIVILFKIVELQQWSVADELGNGMVDIGHCYLSFLKVLLYIVILNVVIYETCQLVDLVELGS